MTVSNEGSRMYGRTKFSDDEIANYIVELKKTMADLQELNVTITTLLIV